MTDANTPEEVAPLKPAHDTDAIAAEALEDVKTKRNKVYYTIGANNAGESPFEVAEYLWGKGSFGADLVQANLDRDWEDGVEIVIPDIEF